MIVLSRRLGPVLPASALPVLRAASAVYADDSVPDSLAVAAGAQRLTGSLPAGAVLLTCEGTPTAPEPAGAALLDAVAVMDRLRSPGGCPWDAEQTHESLLQYLVEETYELYQAIEDGERADIREELGDVLLQVLFHARVAAEDPAGDGAPFTIDDVAADLVAKLVGRHPHVFAGTERIDTAVAQEGRWEELKRAEKQRGSAVDGVPLGQPAVALAAKLVSRTARAGLPADLLPTGDDVGARLFREIAAAKRAGEEPESALRTTAREFADTVRAAEKAAGTDPHALTGEAWRAAWPS
ncbi:MazG family protein [Pseudonocardia ailaonensis]|uniref:MazG family protein n=1 Tax=Pseudonocardia ailaonensis TaxID=367279 RepID=A0ABN2MWM6_9PSEU